jgi:hypothetical protein
MIAVFLMTATTPLIAQADEAPEAEPAPAKEAEKSDEKEDAAEEDEDEGSKQVKMVESMFKGLDKLLEGVKITQDSIDGFLKHNSSFDEIADKDEEFDKAKKGNLVEAYNHVIKQEWFKKWGADNKVEDPEQWLKNALRIFTANIVGDSVPDLKESLESLTEGYEQIEEIKDVDPKGYAEAKKQLDDAKELVENMIEAFEIVPELSDEETKLLEKNAEAIADAMEEEVRPEEGEDGADDEDGTDK